MNYLFAIHNTEAQRTYLGIAANPYSVRDLHYKLLKQHNMYFIPEMRQDFMQHGMKAMRFMVLDTADRRIDLYNIGLALIAEAPENYYNQKEEHFFLN